MEKLHEETKTSSHFYILIPSEVITNSELTDGAKLLYGEILFLSSRKDYCFATNDYFAKLNSVSKRTVNNWLLELRKAGLVSSEIIRNAYNRQVENRKLFIKRDYSIQSQVCMDNTSSHQYDENTKLIFGEHKNVFLSEAEKSELLENCTETILNQEMDSYSVWKKENNAKPKSDFETLRKWLNQKRQKGAYKANITAVKKTGIDEVSQETLDNLPF